MLKVKLLSDTAKVPTIAHPGEDLGYDLYSSHTVTIPKQGQAAINTGISVEYHFESEPSIKIGFLIRDKSSLALKGLGVLGGVIDSGYRGEIIVIMRNFSIEDDYTIQVGQKIANLIPTIVLANKTATVVSELSPALREEKGFGSSGQ